MHQLEFTRTHSYAGRDASINVPVALRSGALFADLVASIDTGASHCLFENAYAARLGLDLTTGVLTRFQTANSIFDAYGHEVEIDVLGIVTHWSIFSPSSQSAKMFWAAEAGWIASA